MTELNKKIAIYEKLEKMYEKNESKMLRDMMQDLYFEIKELLGEE